jgi:putative methanogenesis marker protein 6
MKRYTPSYVGTVTVYIFVESTDFTPEDIAVRAWEIAPKAMVKETCFGLEVTGQPAEVDGIVEKIRAMDPAHIFVKDRGFPPGDPRRCRANLGGARPGFHGHEYELSLIGNVSRGLEEDLHPSGAPVPAARARPKAPLPVEELEKILAEEESAHG